MEKNDIAAVLDEIATFMELTGENPFKIRAYSAGARILENMTEDLGELIDSGKLADIPGLGEALVDKITTSPPASWRSCRSPASVRRRSARSGPSSPSRTSRS
jgi:hypothetical protein